MNGTSPSVSRLLAEPLDGYALALLGTLLSALAGVYTEYLMKKDNDSIYWQNFQLYVFGVLFNTLRLTLDDAREGWQRGFWWASLGKGFNFATWLVVANMAFTGLLVSWIMKYADVLVKVYATSMAMLLTTVLSIFLFNFQPSIMLFFGILICTASLHLYFTPPRRVLQYIERTAVEASQNLRAREKQLKGTE